MLPLAEAGYHVVAPDQRGYGLTTGWDRRYDGDLASFSLINVARDALGLIAALGYESVEAVVGHDFGSPVPSCYIAGASDWGIYQSPGSFERMKASACTNLLSLHLVKGAGHWVQQEQPEEVSALLVGFLEKMDTGR